MTDVTQDALDAALAEAHARFDGKPAEEATASQTPASESEKAAKPEWCEDKFWDAETGQVNTEALARSYGELQKKQSAPKAEGETPAEGEETPAGDTNAVAAALAGAGIDFEAVNAEYQSSEDGELSAATRAKLEAAFGKPLVDNYMAGLKAQEASFSTSYAADVKEAGGGAEGYAKMIAWAKDNLPADEVEEYDEVVNRGDVKLAKLAARDLYARFNAAGGVGPNLVNGGKTNVTDAQGYPNIHAMARDMNDPRYSKDLAFRAEVDRKVEASTALLRR